METGLVISEGREIVKTHLGGLGLEEAKNFKITNFEEKKIAVTRRDLARIAIKTIKEHYGPHKKAAHATWQGICKAETADLRLPQAIEQLYGACITKRELEEAQQRSRKEHEEAERLRKQEEDRRLEEATALEREGRKEEAEAVICEPISPPSVVLPQEEKIEGQYLKDNWSAEIYDLLGFVIGIAEGRIPLVGAMGIEPIESNGNYLYTNKFVNQQARSLKSLLSLPGVRAVNKPQAIKRGLGL